MLLFILTIFIIFSGCIEESKVTQSNESMHQGSVNVTPKNLSSTTLSSEAENIPEIKVRSFSSINTHNNLEKVEGYLFSWDNVPGNESESQRLISYLKNDLNISWIDNAQIVKTNNNETIRVFMYENLLDLTLENNRSTILTTIDSVPGYFFNIKTENGKICVYRLEEYKPGYNLTEKYYAVYDLSIKNNGSNNLDFKLNEFHVRAGDQIFNTTTIFNTTIGPESPYSDRNAILSDLKKETKIEDTILFPGQTVNGSVIFRVNSLYNKSFLLMYKETPITSASFEKSIETLRIAESFDFSTAFGVPPYDSEGWPNWINRSVFESSNKADSESFSEDMANSSSIEFRPYMNIVYAVKVIPERNITVIPVKSSFSRYHPYPLFVVDYTGEELINTSSIENIENLNRLTNEPHSGEYNLSNATIIRISFMSDYDRGRLSFINQDVIMDKGLNINAVSRCCDNFMR